MNTLWLVGARRSGIQNEQIALVEGKVQKYAVERPWIFSQNPPGLLQYIFGFLVDAFKWGIVNDTPNAVVYKKDQFR